MLGKLKIKSIFFQLLEIFPVKMGDEIYHYVQKKFQFSEISYKFLSSKQTYRSLVRILKKAEVRLEGINVLEIGSGWLPLMPYFLLFEGNVKKVETYDLNEHYDPKQIEKLNKYFLTHTHHKFSRLVGDYHLPEEISYYPRTEIISADLKSTDLVFSRFVLEHVSRPNLERMHRYFKENLLPGAHIIHFISPSDHRAFDDASLSLQDFLQYSPEDWNKRQTRFDYHNRLRLPEYISLFQHLGFEIVHLEYDCPKKDSKTFKKFLEVPLHLDYRNFTEEELTAGSINIVLKV